MKVLKRMVLPATVLTALVLVIYLVMEYNQESRELDAEVRTRAPGKFIPLTDGLTHYVELGPSDGPPLVFIHGGGISGMEVWHANAPYFAQQGFRVLLYDLYGRGYSDRVSSDYTPELLQRQFQELIKTINFPDTFAIISMSLGSLIALDYTAQNPTAVTALVMIDPSITGEYRPNVLLRLPLIHKLLMTLYWYPQAIENQRKEFVSQPVFDAYAKRLEYFMKFKGYKHTNYSTWMNTLQQRKIDLLQKLPPQQALLVYGENDPYFPSSNVPIFQAAYPTLQVREVEKTGHLPHYEKPKEVNEILREFLQWVALKQKQKIYVPGNDPSLCVGGTLRLSFFEGLPAYQWKLNGNSINGANRFSYDASLTGTYTLSYLRSGDSTWYTTQPIQVVSRSGSLMSPHISHTGSTSLPIDFHGINNEVILSAQKGFTQYYWYKNFTEKPISTTETPTLHISMGVGKAEHAGTYTVSVRQPNGCVSLPSRPIVVKWNSPLSGLPKLKAPTMSGISSSEVKVSWTEYPEAVRYELWRFRFEEEGYSMESWKLITTVSSGTTSYTDSGLASKAWYRYLVRAILPDGRGVFSAEPVDFGKPL